MGGMKGISWWVRGSC